MSYAGANHGTFSAFACLFLTPNPCGEMIPGSAFLTALNSGDETPGAVSYTTTLAGATNVDTGCIDHLSVLSNLTVGQMAISAAQ
jgi:hypothetical protein